jgi:hypothetical protein
LLCDRALCCDLNLVTADGCGATSSDKPFVLWEEREMAHLYERRVFPYPGDKEAVQEFIEKGGAYGTTIGSHDVRQKAKDNRVADLQKERFEREAQKLWLRMQNEVLREFHEQGFSLTATSESE